MDIFAEEKTRERIQLSFAWPKMRKKIQEWCKSCEDCQLNLRNMTLDRVPITPIPREEVPFRYMQMDLMGPIELTSAAGHQYCLCAVDLCTRWPSIYLLRSLTAKVNCHAFLELFVNVRVPAVIT